MPDAARRTARTYLPYGVPVPVGQVVYADPEPYNPAKHGPPKPSSIRPEENEAAIRSHDVAERLASMRARERRSSKRDGPLAILEPCDTCPPPEPPPPPGTLEAGTELNVGGIWARNDAQRNLTPPRRDYKITIYAPTHYPSAWSCVEAVTVHQREANSSAVRHAFWIWDWCREVDVVLDVGMFGSFAEKYIRVMSVPDASEFAEEVFQVIAQSTTNAVDGECWRVLLYNYSTGHWENVTPGGSICGGSQANRSRGWTMWESYGLADHQDCPSLPSVRASMIMRPIEPMYSFWTELTAADHIEDFARFYCFGNELYTFEWVTPSFWRARTP